MLFFGTDVAAARLAETRPGPWGNPVVDNDVMAGAVQPGEGQLLYGLVRALQPEAVLEIGTGYGISTLFLAAGCRDNGKGAVHTVERHEGRFMAAANALAEQKLSAWAHFYLGEPPAMRPWGLVFLDGPHDRLGVVEWLGRVREHLARGAVVAIHDATWQEHVAQAVDREQWAMVMLPATSLCGLALLTARG